MSRRSTGRARASEKPIAVVSMVGPHAQAESRSYVPCNRRSGTVALSDCASCAHAETIKYDRNGGPVALICRDSLQPPGLASAELLQVPRPRVADLMTRNVVCVRPELSLDAVSQLFLERGLRAAPVVDESHRLLGIVSEADIRLEATTRGDAWRAVSDAMQPTVLTIPENTAVTMAAAIMVYEEAHFVVVVSGEGTVIGVLSCSDVLRWLARADGYRLGANEPVTRAAAPGALAAGARG